ncbi:MAG TPA: glycosyltransferase family 9 protein [Chlamydiales bacterium]|nr:glycosyltransferase family 9 protein [Chlamydiales bacterium]
MKILIVKSSSLGDIIQCFPVVNYLHQLFPNANIDWVVEENFLSLVQSHPYVHRAIPKKWSEIRRERYDYLFDLQGNCKSGVIDLIAISKRKIGFANPREWPNILCTNTRFSVPKEWNIRLQYLSIVEQFFRKKIDSAQSITLQASDFERIEPYCKKYVMVCPGSKWKNKQLKDETLRLFLHRIFELYKMPFLFVWGSQEEKEYCEKIQTPESVILPMRLEIPTWQHLMNAMELVIAVDSSALHLCGTTNVPSFSVFGPTIANVFKPIGDQHYAYQGKCPYNRTFLKQCPILRSCATGACIRDIATEDLLREFSLWWTTLTQKTSKNL